MGMKEKLLAINSVGHKQEGLQHKGCIMRRMQDYSLWHKRIVFVSCSERKLQSSNVEGGKDSPGYRGKMKKERMQCGLGWSPGRCLMPRAGAVPGALPAALVLAVVLGWAPVGRSWWDTVETLHPLGSSQPSWYPGRCFWQWMLEQQWCWQPNRQEFRWKERKHQSCLWAAFRERYPKLFWKLHKEDRKAWSEETLVFFKAVRTVQNAEKQLLKKSWKTVSASHVIVSFLCQHSANASGCYSKKMSLLSVAWHKIRVSSYWHIFSEAVGRLTEAAYLKSSKVFCLLLAFNLGFICSY